MLKIHLIKLAFLDQKEWTSNFILDSAFIASLDTRLFYHPFSEESALFEILYKLNELSLTFKSLIKSETGLDQGQRPEPYH